jgi:hypothetical protein
MASNSLIEELSSSIGSNVGTLSDHLRATSRPFPSFDVDGPVDVTGHAEGAEQARQAAITQCRELLDLLQGPQMCVRPCVSGSPEYCIQ